MRSMLSVILITFSGPVLAGGVVLPEGWTGGISGGCAQDAPFVTLIGPKGEWEIDYNTKVTILTSKDAKWLIKCGIDGGFVSLSTTCFKAGKIIAGRQDNEAAVYCYPE